MILHRPIIEQRNTQRRPIPTAGQMRPDSIDRSIWGPKRSAPTMVDGFESRQSTSECALQVVTEPDSAAWPCLLASRARRRPRLKKRRLLPSSVKRLAAHASSGFFFDGTIRPSKRLPIAQLPATSHIKPAITGRAEHALPIITSLASCCRRRLHLALSIAPDAGLRTTCKAFGGPSEASRAAPGASWSHWPARP